MAKAVSLRMANFMMLLCVLMLLFVFYVMFYAAPTTAIKSGSDFGNNLILTRVVVRGQGHGFYAQVSTYVGTVTTRMLPSTSSKTAENRKILMLLAPLMRIEMT
jgi:hypothetical protein